MILAAGLTPAWQQILVFSQFRVGEVNRAAEATWCASGKVLNVGCALHHLGAPSHTLCLIGGDTGAAIRREFAALGVPATWIDSTTPTRVCTTILDRATGQTTELVQNCGPATSEELDLFATMLVQQARDAAVVVLSGSLPAGTPRDFYRRLLQSVRVRTVLDIRGSELRECLSLKPWLVKPNREELAATVGRPLLTDHDVLAAMQELRTLGAEHVVVSDGPRAVWSLGPSGPDRFVPPAVNVVNPIGCGDCLAAGLAVAAYEDRPWRECIEFGIAAAAENATRLLPGRISRPTII